MKYTLILVVAVAFVTLSSANACKYCYRPGGSGGEGASPQAGVPGAKVASSRLLAPVKPKNALDDKFFEKAEAPANQEAPAAPAQEKREREQFETDTVYGTP